MLEWTHSEIIRLQTATLEGLVILYHLCGERAVVRGFAGVTIKFTWYPSMRFSTYFMIPTPTLSFPVHRYSILYSLLPSCSTGKDWFPSVPPWENLVILQNYLPTRLYIMTSPSVNVTSSSSFLIYYYYIIIIIIIIIIICDQSQHAYYLISLKWNADKSWLTSLTRRLEQLITFWTSIDLVCAAVAEGTCGCASYVVNIVIAAVCHFDGIWPVAAVWSPVEANCPGDLTISHRGMSTI